ncbi:PilW family protein [Pseudomonas sp.]|uniref:PilW family protein n=1 Tax=Pseudomonas sp. TaxID=306 RepID=UPI00272D620E|nr:pilus assembly protein PilW [Pseudomonas sp.]
MKSPAQEGGFGLVEVLIALVLGLIVVLGVIQVFLGNNQAYALQRKVAAMQEDARFVLTRMASEIRMVNMYGCLNRSRLANADSFPAAFDTPISYESGRLKIITADPNAESFVTQTTRTLPGLGAKWLIATDCRSEARIADSGAVVVNPGDVLIPLRQVEYRVDEHRLQVRSNGSGSFQTLIDGVVGLDISFALAAAAGDLNVAGDYQGSVADADFDRIRSVRLALQLSDSPDNPMNAQVGTQEFTVVAALRNRMD